jgi:hypothetical protein
MKILLKDIFAKTIIKILVGIDIIFLFILIPLGFILSKEPNKISLLIFVIFDFITICFFVFFVQINHKYRSELQFEIFTMFFMVGSFLGMIPLFFLMIKELLIGSIFTFLFLNLFFICLYTRIYLWEKHDNVKKHKYKK